MTGTVYLVGAGPGAPDLLTVRAARLLAVVVRLKGGDPMLFGRAQEEIEALERANVRYQVVPGITAALAAAATIGTSLTQRGRVRSFTLATPRVGDGEGASDWIEGFRHADAGAIYMGAREAVRIATALIGAGMVPATPVAIVVDASLASEQTYYTTLARLPAFAESDIGAAALLFVGPQFRPRNRQPGADTRDAPLHARRA
jgi:uroporphyrin-III C-methyltransferase